MPNKWRTLRLSEAQDRRVKLTVEKKNEILRKYQTGAYSLRGLAREYNVSHKTIALIVNPEAKAKNDQYIKDHWMFYILDSESQRLAHRRTEEYKKRLYQKGELK